MTTLQLEQEALKTELSALDLVIPAAPIKNDEELAAVSLSIKKAKDFRAALEEKHQVTAKKQRAYKVYQDALENEHIAYDDIDAFIEAQTKRGKQYKTLVIQKAREEAELAEAKRRDEEAKEKARLEAKAEKELDKGNVAKAEALLEQAETPKTSFSPTYSAGGKLVTKAKVLDLMKLCKLIIDGEIGINVLEVKEGELNKWAANKSIRDKFDGIELYEVAAGRI